MAEKDIDPIRIENIYTDPKETKEGNWIPLWLVDGEVQDLKTVLISLADPVEGISEIQNRKVENLIRIDINKSIKEDTFFRWKQNLAAEILIVQW